MQSIVVVTSIKEREEVLEYLQDTLKAAYHTDLSISIIQSNLNKIDVYHEVKGMKHLVGSYIVVLIPITMSLESLYGYSPTANININRVIARLESMKAIAINFVNSRKQTSKTTQRQNMALAKAAKLLFD